MYAAGNPQTRRNGKLQSCEPCRKSKLRCDHVRPVCQRCSSTGISQHCFYHPAPMTKSAGMDRDRQSSEPHNRQTNGFRSSLDTAQIPKSENPDLEFSRGPPGYLGSTSYSAVLMEHHFDAPLDIDNLPGADNAIQIMNHERVQSGANALALWYNLPICEALVRRHFQNDFFTQLDRAINELMLISIRHIFNTFGAKETKSCLEKFSRQIFCNSSQPLKYHQSMTAQEYVASLSGQNCRWETIGLLFAMAGEKFMTLADNDPLILELSEKTGAKEQIISRIVEATSICIAFCDHAASPNEILAWAQYHDAVLRTQKYGDSSYQVWRRLGDVSATVYAAGLHKVDGPTDKDCPFFVKVIRRSVFAAAFTMDKGMATFVGRPPLINYRYCSVALPLDLTDELYTDKITLDAALAELDATGWSRSMDMKGRRLGLTRIQMILALFREEVLELALGDYHQDILKRSMMILETARAAWDACPDLLKYNSLITLDTTLQNSTSLQFFINHLDYLYSEFLLYRTLVKHSDFNKAPLFDTARQLLDAVNKIFASREKSLNHGGTHSWLIMTYGVPSATLLAFEIFQQTQYAGPHAVSLPRAEIIRNLSIFISCLGWATLQFHGNYWICKEAEQKLSHVLDRILDPPRSLTNNVTLINDVSIDLGAFLDWNPTFVDWNLNSNWDVNTGSFSQ